jgi:hypothetical protein
MSEAVWADVDGVRVTGADLPVDVDSVMTSFRGKNVLVVNDGLSVRRACEVVAGWLGLAAVEQRTTVEGVRVAWADLPADVASAWVERPATATAKACWTLVIRSSMTIRESREHVIALLGAGVRLPAMLAC